MVRNLLLCFLIGSVLNCTPKTNESAITLSKIKLETLQGKAIDLTTYEGRTIFLNFWATWCKPCLQEMPTIEKAMNDLKGEDIVFLFASDEEAEQIESFRSARKFNFEYVRVLNATELNLQALPTTFIFNQDGDLVFNDMGYRDWSIDKNKNLILNNE